MANVVVVGAQWGDEGKGKIVDWLSERADVIARFQGGHNAGHTLVIDGMVYKLSLLPSGIVRGGKLSVIGNGVVLDPWALLSEIEKLRGQGVDVNPENLMVAENTPLILPVHGELDRAREGQNAVAKIGTTGRGIGPAYEDKVGRRAIRVADIFDEATLDTRIGRLLTHHNALRAGLGAGARGAVAAWRAAAESVCWVMMSTPWSMAALAASASLPASNQVLTQMTFSLNSGLTVRAPCRKALMPATTSGMGKDAM